MSDCKWTKGPWEIERFSDGEIAIVGDIRQVGDDEEHCTHVVEFQRMQEANAHLIAAAPEMCALLEFISTATSSGKDFAPEINALLAKARGEQ